MTKKKPPRVFIGAMVEPETKEALRGLAKAADRSFSDFLRLHLEDLVSQSQQEPQERRRSPGTRRATA